MFYEMLKNVANALTDFEVAPPQRNRKSWETLPVTIRQELLDQAESRKNQPWPELPMSQFLQYTSEGNRIAYESLYFQRRNTLNDLVLAECVQNNQDRLYPIVDAVFSICEESGWQLPAHNSYIRDQPCYPLPKSNKPIIDLFSAETGAQLALTAHLLEDAFNEIDPEICARIQRELDTRIIQPYLHEHFWWMGNGDERMNNWTVWCTQNILVVAFCRPFSQPVRMAVINKATKSIDAFLKDYGDDGASDEGAYYYHHAGLCLVSCLHILASVAPNAFQSLWHNKKIRNIAEFIVHMEINTGRYFNFSDCPAVLEACGAREFIFAKQLNSATLKDYAARVWRHQRVHCLPEEISLLQRLQAIFTAKEIAQHEDSGQTKSDQYFPSTGLLVAHDNAFNLLVKAGSNDNSGHNHNDVGNVILYKHGKPILIDLGCENYTAKTFSAQRYDIWTMQSAFHNLPTFNGVMQLNGAEYKASKVDVSLGSNEATMGMNIETAYPSQAGIKQYRRTVRFLKGQYVELEDVLTVDGTSNTHNTVVLSLMFALKPTVSDHKITLANVASMRLTGAKNISVETIQITDSRLLASWPNTLYRVLIPFNEQRLTLRIE